MQFVIDTEMLKEKSLSIDEMLYLISLYLETPMIETTGANCSLKGYTMPFEKGHYPPAELTSQGTQLVEEMFMNSEFKSSAKKEGRFEKLAEKLRDIFPAGRKDGTSLMWRDSKAIIATKLKALVKKYGDCFTDEQAIEATKRYVESFNGQYQYMQVLKYFILKNKVVMQEDGRGKVEEQSQLLSYIENKDASNINDDWAVTLK